MGRSLGKSKKRRPLHNVARFDDEFFSGMGIVELALGVGADLFCGAALGAVGIEANVRVEIGEGGLIIFLAEMDQREQPVDFGLLRREGFRRFRRVQRGFEMHAV